MKNWLDALVLLDETSDLLDDYVDVEDSFGEDGYRPKPNPAMRLKGEIDEFLRRVRAEVSVDGVAHRHGGVAWPSAEQCPICREITEARDVLTSTSSVLRGMTRDRRIPQDVKDALWIRIGRIEQWGGQVMQIGEGEV